MARIIIHFFSKTVLFCIFIVGTVESVAQTYYGNNMFGKIKLLNDSIATVCFFHANTYNINDTCSITKRGDTVFFSSKVTWGYKVHLFEDSLSKENLDYLESAILYKMSYYSSYEWSPGKLYGAWYDKEYKMNIMESYECFQENNLYIIVIADIFGTSERVAFSPEKSGCYYHIGLERNPCYEKYKYGVILNEFPFLDKGNRLVPINDIKQFQCWIDNGFLFPVMKKSKNCEKKYSRQEVTKKGINNLPFGTIRLKHSIPKKYFDVVRDKRNAIYFPSIIEK